MQKAQILPNSFIPLANLESGKLLAIIHSGQMSQTKANNLINPALARKGGVNILISFLPILPQNHPC